MKVVLIIIVIQYTIYFTFEYFIYQSHHHWCSKCAIAIKIERRKKEEASIKRPVFTQGVVDCSDVGGPTIVNFRFCDHYLTTLLYQISLACDIAMKVAFLVSSLQSQCWESPFVSATRLGACDLSGVSDSVLLFLKFKQH